MLDITLIGTSALAPLPGRALTAAVLVCNGRSILFDCGEGTQTAARAAHVNILRADVIALTHYHGDHVFGLPGLLQTMGQMERTEPLVFTGPGKVEAELSAILSLAGRLPYPVSFLELPPEGLKLAEVFHGWPNEARLAAFATEHRVPSQGYVFNLGRQGKFMPQAAIELGIPVKLWKNLQKGETVQADGKMFAPEHVLGPARKGLKFVFSGDTLPCETLLEAAKDADLFISEATYGENEQAELAVKHGHMTFSQAAGLAADAHAARLWLTHFSHMIENPADYLDNARAFYPEAVCGTDGMSITLRFD